MESTGLAIIRCTKRLLDEVGIRANDLCSKTAPSVSLTEWYGQLFMVRGKKCVLFMETQTLFVSLAWEVSRPQIRDLPRLLEEGVRGTLLAESVGEEIVDEVVAPLKSAQLAKTVDRRILGCINDLLSHVPWRLGDDDLSDSRVQRTVEQALNRTPWVKREHPYATDAITVELRKRFLWRGEFWRR